LKKIRGLIGLGLVLAVLLSACESLPWDLTGAQKHTATPTIAPGSGGEMTPTPEMTTTVEVTPEPVTKLTVWVAPEMDPAAETEASQSFAAQLGLFSDLHDGLEIVVRVKAASGTGGLLDALTATAAAAPEALPDLVALDRPDLETAALKGLIYPLDGMTAMPDDADWYGFTREMALLQGSTFGLPYAADALVMAYRPELLPEIPGSWGELIEQEQVLAFPADSDQALFTLALYQADGGLIQDNQRRPVLELDPLSNVFGLYQAGVRSGALPNWLSQYQTLGQVWSSYREGQSNLAVTWLSNYLKDQPGDTSVASLIPLSAGAVTLGTGMSWTVATAVPTRQALAVQLAEFLVQPEFLAEWTAAAGFIPPRPSALESWTDQGLRNTVGQVALMTRLRPTNDLITSLGPILREGTRQILQDLVDPVQAAQVAVDSLEE
jgi:multiple sugar transport system substrate-binding protein